MPSDDSNLFSFLFGGLLGMAFGVDECLHSEKYDDFTDLTGFIDSCPAKMAAVALAAAVASLLVNYVACEFDPENEATLSPPRLGYNSVTVEGAWEVEQEIHLRNIKLMAGLKPALACYPYIKWSLLFIGLFKLVAGSTLGIVNLLVYLKQQQFPRSDVTSALNYGINNNCFFSASFFISGCLATYGSLFERLAPLIMVTILSSFNIGAISLSSHLAHQSPLNSYKSSDGLKTLPLKSDVNESSTSLIEDVQRNLKCCGIQSNTDWLSVNDTKKRDALISSCRVDNSTKDIQKRGCFEKLSNMLQVVHIIKLVTVPVFIIVLITCFIGILLAVAMSLILSYAYGVDAVRSEKAWSPLIFFHDN